MMYFVGFEDHWVAFADNFQDPAIHAEDSEFGFSERREDILGETHPEVLARANKRKPQFVPCDRSFKVNVNDETRSDLDVELFWRWLQFRTLLRVADEEGRIHWQVPKDEFLQSLPADAVYHDSVRARPVSEFLGTFSKIGDDAAL